MAKIVRSILRKEDMDLAKILGGPESLEMLIEIGIEKLKRDYTQTMLNNTLATREDLAKIIEDQNEIVVLRKLHCIQCLICLCQTFLPSNQGLYFITKWELKRSQNYIQKFYRSKFKKLFYFFPEFYLITVVCILVRTASFPRF